MWGRNTAMKTDFLLNDSGVSLALCSQAPQNDVSARWPSGFPAGLLESYTNPFPKQEQTPETEGLKMASSSHILHRGCLVCNTGLALIPQDGKGPCKEGISLAVQRGKIMFNVQFPILGLSPAHLCPGEVIHTLSPNCPSYPGPISLLWCLTIQPLPSPKELQGALLLLSKCYPLNSCPLCLVTCPRFPPPPKITFFQNRHCRLNHQLQWHF